MRVKTGMRFGVLAAIASMLEGNKLMPSHEQISEKTIESKVIRRAGCGGMGFSAAAVKRASNKQRNRRKYKSMVKRKQGSNR